MSPLNVLPWSHSWLFGKALLYIIKKPDLLHQQ